uniref:Uncharacterized protein n=1 Tax=Oryzias latipes TaxID=8090 RepID=A0A3B3HZE9_ORYLA
SLALISALRLARRVLMGTGLQILICLEGGDSVVSISTGLLRRLGGSAVSCSDSVHHSRQHTCDAAKTQFQLNVWKHSEFSHSILTTQCGRMFLKCSGGPFCVEFVCFPVHEWVFFGDSGFLPPSKNLLHRLIGFTKLSLGVNVRVHGCVIVVQKPTSG